MIMLLSFYVRLAHDSDGADVASWKFVSFVSIKEFQVSQF